jgi:hypothetical protein
MTGVYLILPVQMSDITSNPMVELSMRLITGRMCPTLEKIKTVFIYVAINRSVYYLGFFIWLN